VVLVAQLLVIGDDGLELLHQPADVIAAEIGDKSGATIIEKVYGGLPPNWMTTDKGKIGWLPANGEPAWKLFLERRPENLLQLPSAI